MDNIIPRGHAALFHGTAIVGDVTPKEHSGLPNKQDVRDGIRQQKAMEFVQQGADLSQGSSRINEV